jgi:hypothetical protein
VSGSEFKYHTACPNPKCGSSDAFSIWEDGHGYCFSCHFYKPSDYLAMLDSAASAHLRDMTHNPGIKASPVQNVVKGVYLPSDCSKTIDAMALQWLSRYGIMREEIVKYDIQWSPNRHWLVFPIRGGEGELLAYQARCFPQLGETKVDKKWMSFGVLADIIHVVDGPKGTGRYTRHEPVCIVEDIVSAYKVARHCRAMPLFGSHLSTRKMLMLRKMFTDKLVIWLDHDKYKEAIGGAKRAEIMGLEAHCIYTDLDPKDFKDDDIKRTLMI